MRRVLSVAIIILMTACSGDGDEASRDTSPPTTADRWGICFDNVVALYDRLAVEYPADGAITQWTPSGTMEYEMFARLWFDAHDVYGREGQQAGDVYLLNGEAALCRDVAIRMLMSS